MRRQYRRYKGGGPAPQNPYQSWMSTGDGPPDTVTPETESGFSFSEAADYAGPALSAAGSTIARSTGKESGSAEQGFDVAQEGVASAIPIAGLFHGLSEGGQGIARASMGSDERQRDKAGRVSGYLFEPHTLITEGLVGDSRRDADPVYKQNVNRTAGNITYKQRLGGKGAPNAELEGGEVLEKAGGTNERIKGPSHERGGVKKNLKSGDYVWSKALKIKDPESGTDISIADMYMKIKDNPEAVERLRAYQEQVSGRAGGGEEAGPEFQKGGAVDPKRSKMGRAFYGSGPYIADTVGAAAQIAALAFQDQKKVKPIKYNPVVAERVGLTRGRDTGAGERQRDSRSIINEANTRLSAPAAISKGQASQQAKHRADQQAQLQLLDANTQIDAKERTFNAEQALTADRVNRDNKRLAEQSSRDEKLRRLRNKNAITAGYGDAISGFAKDIKQEMDQTGYERGILEGTGIYEMNRDYNFNRYITEYMRENKSTYDEALAAFQKAVAKDKK